MTDFIRPKGINFSCCEQLSPIDFSTALTKIANFIKEINTYDKLERYDDWWEHDGLHFHRNSISLEDFFKIVSSPRLLSEAMSSDWYVFIGIAPTNNNWYLRFYLNDEDGEEDLVTHFDITFPKEIAERFKAEVLSKLSLQIKEQNAETYYQTIIL